MARGTLPGEVINIDDDFPGYSLDSFIIPENYSRDLECVLIPHGLIANRVEKLASDILISFPAHQDLVCICVLKSAFGFFTALTQAMQRISQANLPKRQDVYSLIRMDSVDPHTVSSASSNSRSFLFEFITVSSYVNDKSSGEVSISGISDLGKTITGKNVLLVEDMIDTGTTMLHLLEKLEQFDPKILKGF